MQEAVAQCAGTAAVKVAPVLPGGSSRRDGENGHTRAHKNKNQRQGGTVERKRNERKTPMKWPKMAATLPKSTTAKCKRRPIATQEMTFCTPKDALSQGKRPPFAIQRNDETAGSNTEVAENKTLRPNGRLGFKVPGKRPLLLN